jgi:hypothetical protein
MSASTRRLAALLILLPLPVLGNPHKPSRPISRSGQFHLPASCARAMPLFTAAGEMLWAPGWMPQMLSGGTARGSVFRTHHGGRTTVWIVVDYDPGAGRASYARLVEGSDMGLVDVRCTGDGKGSGVQVTYTLTGLDADGAAFAARFLAPAHYRAMLDDWQRALVAALDAPEPAPASHPQAGR